MGEAQQGVATNGARAESTSEQGWGKDVDDGEDSPCLLEHYRNEECRRHLLKRESRPIDISMLVFPNDVEQLAQGSYASNQRRQQWPLAIDKEARRGRRLSLRRTCQQSDATENEMITGQAFHG